MSVFGFSCLWVYFSCESPVFAIYVARGFYISVIRILYVYVWEGVESEAS